MKASKQSGIALLEVLLAIVLLTGVAGTGYYVWHSKQTTDATYAQTSKVAQAKVSKAQAKQDPACTFQNGQKGRLIPGAKEGFWVCTPDGWTLFYVADTMHLFTDTTNMVYKVDMVPKLQPTGGSDNNYPFAIDYSSKESFKDDQLSKFDVQAAPSSVKNYKITKYFHLTGKDDVVGSGIDYLPQGTKQYRYVIEKDSAVVAVSYNIAPDALDQLVLVDQIVANIQ